MWAKDASLQSNSDEDVLMELLATDLNGYFSSDGSWGCADSVGSCSPTVSSASR
jgi:hypothetical protein